MMDGAKPKDLLVYLHIPFCTSKCYFCDWVQEVPPGDLRLGCSDVRRIAYINALRRQIAQFAATQTAHEYRPAILYWGGGTASLLEADEIIALMDGLSAWFDPAGLDEATIECSPETLTLDKLRLFRRLGFRRISIGVQSTNDARLRRIGRAHDSKTAFASIRLAAEAGFAEINADLISGFPGETLEEFERSLDDVLALPVTHISLYPYRPATGTTLRRTAGSERVGVIDLAEQLAAYAMGQRKLAAAGLPEYALAHFGRTPCSSDLAYFQLRMDWIGFGSGATSLFDKRFASTRRGDLNGYIEDPSAPDDIYPAASGRITPRLLYQALSTWEGAEASLWTERLGVPFDDVLDQHEVKHLIAHLRQFGPVIRESDRLYVPTEAIPQVFIRALYSGAPTRARQEAPLLHGAY